MCVCCLEHDMCVCFKFACSEVAFCNWPWVWSGAPGRLPVNESCPKQMFSLTGSRPFSFCSSEMSWACDSFFALRGSWDVGGCCRRFQRAFVQASKRSEVCCGSSVVKFVPWLLEHGEHGEHVYATCHNNFRNHESPWHGCHLSPAFSPDASNPKLFLNL